MRKIRKSYLLIAALLFLLVCNLMSGPATNPAPLGPSAAETSPTSANPQTTPSVQSNAPAAIRYVPGSSQKICQLVGEGGREFNQPTANQTESRYGLVGDDLGYSFESSGKLFFLFGDSNPTAIYSGKPNLGKDPPRIPETFPTKPFNPATDY